MQVNPNIQIYSLAHGQSDLSEQNKTKGTWKANYENNFKGPTEGTQVTELIQCERILRTVTT